jgi:SSS family solute:Na+ symporter
VSEVLGTRHFGGSLADFPFTDTKVYIALTALLINILVAVILTAILRALKVPDGTDHTSPQDYYADGPAVVSRKRVTA